MPIFLTPDNDESSDGGRDIVMELAWTIATIVMVLLIVGALVLVW